MRLFQYVRLAMVCLCLLVGTPTLPGTATDSSATRARVLSQYGALPLHFEINRGQTDDAVDFLARGAGYSLFLTRGEAVFRLAGSAADDGIVRIALAGANSAAAAEGLDPLPGRSHYFVGNDPERWTDNLTHYARVKYHQVYEGVDLVYYGNQRQLEYDFVVAPRHDPRRIRLAIDGVQQLRLNAQGDLVLTTRSGEIVQHKPVIYQHIDGARQPVDGSYRLLAESEVGFDVGSYDTSRELVIDPVVVYSTYLGGSSSELDTKIAVDGSGNAYVAGTTMSTDFPTLGAIQPAFGGGTDVPHDAFVTKLNANGTALVYSTYLGGAGNDRAFDIAVDGSANAYVTGMTTSANFVTTVGSFQSSYGGFVDAFVTKLAPAGTLVFSTYVGSPGSESALAIAVDGSGQAYITGETSSSTYPTTGGVVQPTSGTMFLTKLNAAGSALVYSTFLAGAGLARPNAIALDGAGNAYVGGATYEADYPTTAGAFQPTITPGGFSDAFVTKVNADASALVYSTYLGGSENEYEITGIAVDASGHAFVTGRSRSTDFPTTAGAFQTTLAGQDDVFVTKFNPAGSGLVYSTFVGGSDNDFSGGLAIDGSGNAYIAGGTSSANFPTVAASQSALNGAADAFVANLNPAGSALLYSTFYGGSNSEGATGIAMDASGSIYITGTTSSADLPVTSGVFQSAPAGGSSDAFVAKFGDAPVTPTVLRPPTNLTAISIVGNTVTLGFTAPTDSITPTGYVLEGGVAPGQVLASIATGSTATIFTFTAPTGAFYIRVHSVAGSQKSVASNEIQIFVNTPAPPSAPANLLALVNGSALNLEWLNTAAGGTPTHLILDVTGSVTTSLSLPVSEGAAFLSVPAGLYTLSLRAANASGTSPSSNSVTVTVPSACSGTPLTPANFTLAKSGNVITASWGLPATGPAPTGYTVMVTGTFTGAFPVSSRSISGAVGPGTYTLSVVATNPCGASAPTATQAITVP
jgi:hypothetical protein